MQLRFITSNFQFQPGILYDPDFIKIMHNCNRQNQSINGGKGIFHPLYMLKQFSLDGKWIISCNFPRMSKQ